MAGRHGRGRRLLALQLLDRSIERYRQTGPLPRVDRATAQPKPRILRMGSSSRPPAEPRRRGRKHDRISGQRNACGQRTHNSHRPIIHNYWFDVETLSLSHLGIVGSTRARRSARWSYSLPRPPRRRVASAVRGVGAGKAIIELRWRSSHSPQERLGLRRSPLTIATSPCLLGDPSKMGRSLDSAIGRRSVVSEERSGTPRPGNSRRLRPRPASRRRRLDRRPPRR